MTEAQLQDAVIETARLLGWKVAHFRPARVMRGGREVYETPVSADGRGFPDLVLVRGERLIFAELKSATGRLSPDQDAWIAALVPTAAVAVWQPRDWESGAIEAELRRTETADQEFTRLCA